MMRCTALFRQTARDESGAAMVEFALIAPVLCMTLMGLFEVSHEMYVASVVEGAIHQAGRDNTIEDALDGSAGLDARVRGRVLEVVPKDAIIRFQRHSYENFSDVGSAEEFTDQNGDGTCNDGEPFVDANSNGRWDRDRGAQGDYGTASDAVLYRVVVRYQRLFPVAKLIGMDNNVYIRRQVLLRNQPYSTQNARATVDYCT